MPDSEGRTSGRALQLVELRKQFGRATAVQEVSLEVAQGEFVTLLGPSGCGKTTTIRMVAGYVEPSGGQILVGARDITHLPPQKRKMGMVFQDYALFPHLRVRENVAFGLRMQRIPKRERLRAADEKLELVSLGDAAGKYPSELSGGMRQRVALARALAINPEVLLLDEPFSALDAKLRTSLRDEVRRIQKATGVTTILVTHDQHEAFSVSDRILVMRAGAVEQVGAPRELYRHPRSEFVLDFVGRSTSFSATVIDHFPDRAVVVCKAGRATVTAADPGGCSRGEVVSLAVRPENVVLRSDDAGAGLGNALKGTVTSVDFTGGVEHAAVHLSAMPISILSDMITGSASKPRRVGDHVVAYFDPEDVMVLKDEHSDDTCLGPEVSL